MTEPKREFEYERQAAEGEPMPDGLKLHEQIMYLALRYIYKEYFDGRLTKEQAGEEKRKCFVEYDKAEKQFKLSDELCKYRARQTLMTSQLVCEFRKNPSLETAHGICNVLDGIKRAMDTGVET